MSMLRQQQQVVTLVEGARQEAVLLVVTKIVTVARIEQKIFYPQ
jgi:hypothetical protein